MKVEAVLLDLDGTLIDTAPDLVAVLNILLAHRRLPPIPFAIARNEVSNGALGLIRLGLGEQESEEEVERLRQEFLEVYIQNICIKSSLFNGIGAILNDLDECGTSWGIVTNKPHAMTQPLLKSLNLLHRPGCLICGDSLPQRKPHPAPLQAGAKELGIPTKHCVYVGDARKDIDAGRAAGMPTIAASYGYIHPYDDPYQWGASAVIRRPADLLNALKELE
ncbi:MAG: phosphoglycolate phosphatase [Pseudomonadota bacterium]|nr:phosphoglycolate phosphatase [Pseudomonadota bacterium]